MNLVLVNQGCAPYRLRSSETAHGKNEALVRGEIDAAVGVKLGGSVHTMEFVVVALDDDRK